LLHIDMVGMGTIDMPFMMAPLFDDADADIEGMGALIIIGAAEPVDIAMPAERIEEACAGETVVVEVELDSIVAMDIIEDEVEVELDIIVAMDIIEVEVLLPQLLPLHIMLLLLGGQLLPLHIMLLLLGGQLLPLHIMLLLGGQLLPLHIMLLLGGQLLPLHIMLLLGGQLLPLHMLSLPLPLLLSTMTSVVTSIEMDSESMKVIRGPATIALL